MRTVGRQGKTETDRVRRELLAKVHIAVRDLHLPLLMYEDIKRGRYGVESAAELSNQQLEDLVRYFVKLGWRPSKGSRGKTQGARHGQVEALRDRAGEIALDLENRERRLNALVEKICGVERLKWCHDIRKSKQLVATLESIRRQGGMRYASYIILPVMVGAMAAWILWFVACCVLLDIVAVLGQVGPRDFRK